jgi:hypothetical protein
MANANLTIDMITREALRILKNNLAFTRGVNRQYDSSFAKAGAEIGDTLRIRKPPRYVGRTGTALSVEDHVETSVNLALDTQFGVDINFTSKELSLDIKEFSKRVLQPAICTVANKVDFDGMSLYKKVPNAVGVYGTVNTAIKTFAQASAKISQNGGPVDSLRSVCVEPLAEVEIIDQLKGLFQSSEQIKKQYEDGLMGKAAGLNWSMSQNVAQHTVGTHGGTPLVAGASQSGSTLATDGWSTSTAILKEGDIFTIANVFGVNPQNRQSTGSLQQFVVTADTSSDGSGLASLAIYPAITASGAFQTVNSVPADNAAITVLGTADSSGYANLAFHRDAFVLGTADLLLPQGVHQAARVSDSDTGLSVRMVRQYDINNDKMPCRFDILYGWQAVYPELAARIHG